MIKKNKWITAFLSILAIGTIYNLDSIIGQWKFKRLCETEGGPKFYIPIEKNAGWTVKEIGKYAYQSPFYFGQVAFSRYTNEKGETIDVYGGGPRGNRKYTFTPVDKTKKIRYLYRYVNGKYPNDKRFSWSRREVIDLQLNQIAASYTSIGYAWTTPERVILAAPTTQVCWIDPFEDFFHRIYDLRN